MRVAEKVCIGMLMSSVQSLFTRQVVTGPESRNVVVSVGSIM